MMTSQRENYWISGDLHFWYQSILPHGPLPGLCPLVLTRHAPQDWLPHRTANAAYTVYLLLQPGWGANGTSVLFLNCADLIVGWVAHLLIFAVLTTVPASDCVSMGCSFSSPFQGARPHVTRQHSGPHAGI